MKKIITILFSVGCFSSVFAQSGKDDRRYQDNKGPYEAAPNYQGNNSKDPRNNAYGRNNDNDAYAYNDRRNNNFSRERAFQMEKINREYDYRINSVMCNRALRPNERNRMVRYLENERAERIRSIAYRYGQDRYQDNHYDRNNNYHH